MSETYPNVNIQLIPGQALFGLDLTHKLNLKNQ